MARLVRFSATGPYKIDPKGLDPEKPIFICGCGLSQNLPYCDGSHKPCRVKEQPGVMYVYDAARREVVREEPDAESAPGA